MLFGKGNARNFWNYVWQTDMRMLHTYDQYWKAKEMPAILFFKYFWRTDGRATGGAEPNATRNWCFVEADGVYFYCFSMIVQSFAEATTDTIWVFYFFNETSILCAQTVHFGAVRRQATSRRQGGAWKSTGKNVYEMKVAVDAKKHIRKRYTHAIAKVTILSKRNASSSGTRTSTHTWKTRVAWKAATAGLVLWCARRTSISEKKLLFAS